MSELETARRQETRYQLLCLLDSERPGFVSEQLLLRGLKGVEASPDTVRRELLYLKQRELVEIKKVSDGSISASLLATAVDLLEGHSPEMVGVVLLGDRLSRMEIERRREIRWRLLRLADINSPVPLSESLAQRAMHDVNLIVSQVDIRRVAVYLEQKGLLQVHRDSAEFWSFEPTAEGFDCCQYAVECPAGIARPER